MAEARALCWTKRLSYTKFDVRCGITLKQTLVFNWDVLEIEFTKSPYSGSSRSKRDYLKLSWRIFAWFLARGPLDRGNSEQARSAKAKVPVNTPGKDSICHILWGIWRAKIFLMNWYWRLSRQLGKLETREVGSAAWKKTGRFRTIYWSWLLFSNEYPRSLKILNIFRVLLLNKCLKDSERL
jgi:hypothetical protein